MSTGFILPIYGHFDYARQAAASFLRARPGGRVYALDDASPDPDAEAKLDEIDSLEGDVVVHRFPENGGLTRSWNFGLRLAKADGLAYTLCGNSDLLFGLQSFDALEEAADRYDLAGPLSNAPGLFLPQRQQVQQYLREYTASDDLAAIDRTAATLTASAFEPLPARINGFCMLARTDRWWAFSYNQDDVFDPSRRMTGNEDEYQKRLRSRGGAAVAVPRSFVFHYRSVSRPKARKTGLWLRKSA